MKRAGGKRVKTDWETTIWVKANNNTKFTDQIPQIVSIAEKFCALRAQRDKAEYQKIENGNLILKKIGTGRWPSIFHREVCEL
ncbi:hypothetical protein KFK09_003386 [Dendrobium nobile]|uniref:Uncharacterized protein n=1 Tax=Dendrobium nobile TaxID=94219 RepID=A0A8T3BXH0_DENNO|nr:hypothetical protein KFK09_003386 [Dendrobium nobile]